MRQSADSAQQANQLAMSTLSFQDYVRERMARRRQEESTESKLIRIPIDEAPAPRAQEPRPVAQMAPQAMRLS